MESVPSYNALVKSISSEISKVKFVPSKLKIRRTGQSCSIKIVAGTGRGVSKGDVIGKVLLTDLNLIPATWTLLFRGKYLSRDVDMTSLFCSPQDPITIFQGIVKHTNFPFSVTIDFTRIPHFEGSEKMTLELDSHDEVSDLVKQVATQLREPTEDVKLMCNATYMKNDDYVINYFKLPKNHKIYATIKVKLTFGPLISETYKVSIEEDEKDIIEFQNSKKSYWTPNAEDDERNKVFKVNSCITVASLREQICKVFQVKPKSHTIFRKGKPLVNSETLESQGFQDNTTINISEKLNYSDLWNVAKRSCPIKKNSTNTIAYKLRQRYGGCRSNNKSFRDFREAIKRSLVEDRSSEDEEVSSEDEEVSREDKEVPSEDKKVSREDKDVSREDKEVSSEDKEVSREDKEVSSEDKKVSREDKDVSREDKEVSSEDKEVSREDKEVSSEDKDVSREDKEVSSEDKEVSREDKEVSSEDKKVSREDKEVSREDKKVSSENKKVSRKDKKVSRKDKKVSRKDKKVSRKDKKVSSEYKEWHQRRYVSGGCRRPTFSAEDVDRKPLTLDGEKPIHNWNFYSHGMTLYGTCPNAHCPSKKTKKKNIHGVSYTAGYGNIFLTPERFKFPCPACREMFPVKEFVLCGGRALFRFKKSGVGEPVKTVVMESKSDSILKYETFGEVGNGRNVKLCEYDFIEITTVKRYRSLYSCVKCDGVIEYKQDENVLRCGHAYHDECTPVSVGGGDDEDDNSIVGCYACLAREVLEMAMVSSESEAACD